MREAIVITKPSSGNMSNRTLQYSTTASTESVRVVFLAVNGSFLPFRTKIIKVFQYTTQLGVAKRTKIDHRSFLACGRTTVKKNRGPLDRQPSLHASLCFSIFLGRHNRGAGRERRDTTKDDNVEERFLLTLTHLPTFPNDVSAYSSMICWLKHIV